jgi:hypothetical protein
MFLVGSTSVLGQKPVVLSILGFISGPCQKEKSVKFVGARCGQQTTNPFSGLCKSIHHPAEPLKNNPQYTGLGLRITSKYDPQKIIASWFPATNLELRERNRGSDGLIDH